MSFPSPAHQNAQNDPKLRGQVMLEVNTLWWEFEKMIDAVRELNRLKQDVRTPISPRHLEKLTIETLVEKVIYVRRALLGQFVDSEAQKIIGAAQRGLRDGANLRTKWERGLPLP